MPKIFFVRHGNCCGSPGLSELGKQELFRVLTKFKDLDFSPKISVTTRAQRCIETARVLVPGVEPIICEDLPCYCIWRDQQKTGDSMLKAIGLHIKEGKDMVVACHDTMPAIMAFRLAEIRGGSIFWESRMSVEMGCGFLLDDKSFVFIEP